MMVLCEVEVSIRKGLGPETFTKMFSVAFDDLPPDTTGFDIYGMAKSEVEGILRRSEDFPLYGKNWEILNVEYA